MSERRLAMSPADVVRGVRPTYSAIGTFAATAAGGFLVSLDVSVANSLLPAIGRDFTGESRAALSWVLTAYAIVFAAALVPAGRIADRAGRRRTYLGGLALFGAGSLGCGLAPDLHVLLLGRVLQAVGAAAASPASLALLLADRGSRERSLYAARWTGAGAAGVCLGPLVGGSLTSLADWRWAFLINIPLVAATAVATRRLLPETDRHPGRRLPDPVGALTFAAAAATLTLTLSEISTWGVGSWKTVCGLTAAALTASGFIVRSRRVSEPMLDLTLLRTRRVAAAAVITSGYAAGFFGFLVSFLLFAVERWQLGLGQAGVAILVPGVVVIALTVHVGRVADRVGHRLPLAVGAGLMSVSLALSALTLRGDHPQARWLALGAVLGLGIGLCYPVLASAAVLGLPATQLGAASAINQCARQLGAAVGVAATVGALGSSTAPALDRFRLAWLIGALFCAAAAGATAFMPRDPS